MKRTYTSCAHHAIDLGSRYGIGGLSVLGALLVVGCVMEDIGMDANEVAIAEAQSAATSDTWSPDDSYASFIRNDTKSLFERTTASKASSSSGCTSRFPPVDRFERCSGH